LTKFGRSIAAPAKFEPAEGGKAKGAFVLRTGADAFAMAGEKGLVALTEAATRATFYREGMDEAQLAANRRVVEISGPICAAASEAAHQHFVAAFDRDETLAGYVIATRHGPGDHELDWLMVHPRRHGSGLAGALMMEGLSWLGSAHPVWLNVIRHNERAIAFYRRFGFEIDPDAPIERPVPHWIMRRPAGVA
jgi:ribosomal protein S18 acetylase RimI-like enzyme